ncbi:MAG: DUF378 domain-containing protein [Planctomycetota bacterium]|jgi:uncharacterized membrane protein YuzA (DUF378 family)
MKTFGWKTLDILVATFLVVGGLNWGLVGFFSFDLVGAILGRMTILSRFVYVLVGLAALYDLAFLRSISRRWHIHFAEPIHA